MACPKCNGTQGYSANDYFSGWAEFLGSWDINDEECATFNDTVIVKKVSKTAVCLDCGARVKRPYNRRG